MVSRRTTRHQTAGTPSRTSLRIAGFDLGVKGAVVRVERMDDGMIVFRGGATWDISKYDDEDRYYEFMRAHAGDICSQTDVVGYELVQFNRGISSIPGLRGVLLACCGVYGIKGWGVNVSTLKARAGHGGFDKEAMENALKVEHRDFYDGLIDRFQKLDDNLIDAAWVCIWMAENIEVGT